jgi:hypothetical protein
VAAAVTTPSETARAVSGFFAEHGVAGLVLPHGWFGRPHDNMHELTSCTAGDDALRVVLDGRQVLTFHGPGTVAAPDLVEIDGASGLRVSGFTRLDWDWHAYGSGESHHQAFLEGETTFVAPFFVAPQRRRGRRGPRRVR